MAKKFKRGDGVWVGIRRTLDDEGSSVARVTYHRKVDSGHEVLVGNLTIGFEHVFSSKREALKRVCQEIQKKVAQVEEIIRQDEQRLRQLNEELSAVYEEILAS